MYRAWHALTMSSTRDECAILKTICETLWGSVRPLGYKAERRTTNPLGQSKKEINGPLWVVVPKAPFHSALDHISPGNMVGMQSY